MKKTNSAGRPQKKTDRKDAVLYVRVSPRFRAAMVAGAEKAGYSDLSEWVRDTLKTEIGYKGPV